MSMDVSAERFVERLKSYLSPVELKKNQHYFKTGPGDYGEGDVFMGVRMGQIFALAKEFIDMHKHATTMPRVALRYAIEHLDKKQRDHYLSMKKVGSLL